MVRFGFIRSNAELIDHERRGEVTILKYEAIGVTKGSAIRGAKREARSIIPMTDQEVINVKRLDGRSRGDNAYLIAITN